MSPWTPQTFKSKHDKKLTLAEATLASRVANESLKRHGDDELAVIAGIAAANNLRKSRKKVK